MHPSAPIYISTPEYASAPKYISAPKYPSTPKYISAPEYISISICYYDSTHLVRIISYTHKYNELNKLNKPVLFEFENYTECFITLFTGHHKVKLYMGG